MYTFLKMKMRVGCASSLVRGFILGEGMLLSYSFAELQSMVVNLIYCPHLSNPKCGKIFTLSHTDIIPSQSSPSYDF